MKILILGATGMLGRYVSTHLRSKYLNVYATNRSDFEIDENVNSQRVCELMKKFDIAKDDVVINCIGLIKPQVDKYGPTLSIIVNSLFPNLLADQCSKIGARAIHITTDCVFSGKRGKYVETDVHDVFDTYGRTKSLGEPNNCTVIRTSIIGEEVGQKRSLVEWVKSNLNKEINGFDNHLWNGLTCLQVAKVLDQMIREDKFWIGVRHIFSNIVDKYELLNMINDSYSLNIKVNKKSADSFCDRSLSSIYENMFEIPDLEDQVAEMQRFKLNE